MSRDATRSMPAAALPGAGLPWAGDEQPLTPGEGLSSCRGKGRRCQRVLAKWLLPCAA